jgi:ABC-2 type transport system ATP-binding protein
VISPDDETTNGLIFTVANNWSGQMNLSIKNVGKQYSGDLWGLRGFSLEIYPGVLGLLGPNGAGKSTLMRIIATISDKTTGEVTWNGMDITRHPNQLRQVLGYLPQDFGVYPNLNAYEFLEYMAAIKGLDGNSAKRRIHELLQLVNLADTARRPLGSYSGGMKQRVGIAQALLNDPQVLIVDEPTAGLDPEERVRFRNLLSDISGERIVILATHIVSDVEAAATAIAIINKGKRIADAPPERIMQAVEGKVWRWVVSSDEFAKLKGSYLISGTARRSDGIHLRVVSARSPDLTAKPVSATLEDAYLYLVNKANGQLDM